MIRRTLLAALAGGLVGSPAGRAAPGDAVPAQPAASAARGQMPAYAAPPTVVPVYYIPAPAVPAPLTPAPAAPGAPTLAPPAPAGPAWVPAPALPAPAYAPPAPAYAPPAPTYDPAYGAPTYAPPAPVYAPPAPAYAPPAPAYAPAGPTVLAPTPIPAPPPAPADSPAPTYAPAPGAFSDACLAPQPPAYEGMASGCEASCADAGRVWGGAEALYWWTKGVRTTPLVTASAAGGLGTLGDPGTSVLYPNGRLLDDGRFGGRVRAGVWCDPCNTWGFDAGGFWLSNRSSRFGAGSDGSQVGLFRPFFDPATGENAELVGFQQNLGGTLSPVLQGTVTVKSTMNLYGGDLNARRGLWLLGHRVDVFAGYRYMQLRDSLSIKEDLQETDPTLATFGSRYQVTDRFRASNNFYGGQIGASSEMTFGRFFVNATAKAAVGVNAQRIRIDGNTTVTDGATGASQSLVGGLLAQSTNVGNYGSSQFSFIPEANVNVGMNLGSHVRVFAGYSFLYWTNVVRAAEQIDRRVNTTFIPTPGGGAAPVGPAVPAFLRKANDFWVQGANAGIEFRW